MLQFDPVLGPMTRLVTRDLIFEIVVAAAATTDERSDAIARSVRDVLW